MACGTCGRELRCHGMESGCHDGVWMDDDVHGEGWVRDVIYYPPCPFNPAACDCVPKPDAMSFREWNQISYGTGLVQDGCPTCNGTGWRDGKWQHPVSIEDLVDADKGE